MRKLKKEGFEPPKEFLIELQSTAFDRSAISSKRLKRDLNP
jgi:hypothetical protein